MIGTAREVSARVNRWRNARMVIRWSATALIEAKHHFHKVRDHRGMKISRPISARSWSELLRQLPYSRNCFIFNSQTDIAL